MPQRRSVQMPDWPRGMSEPLAALYVSLSLSQFRLEVKEKRAPQPGRITRGRQIWLKDDLDEYLDRVFDRRDSRQEGTVVEQGAGFTSLREDLERWQG